MRRDRQQQPHLPIEKVEVKLQAREIACGRDALWLKAPGACGLWAEENAENNVIPTSCPGP